MGTATQLLKKGGGYDCLNRHYDPSPQRFGVCEA